MTIITLYLPWPPAGLQPHAKSHWRPKANATKRYRRDAFWLAKEALVDAGPGAILAFSWHPPDRRRRDTSNMPSQMKPVIDGIADAMGCDDNGFRVRFPETMGEPVKGGCVIVEITAP